LTVVLYRLRQVERRKGGSSSTAWLVVSTCLGLAIATTRAARLTVSPKTSCFSWMTGPTVKPMLTENSPGWARMNTCMAPAACSA
jgi:hypothetical protein